MTSTIVWEQKNGVVWSKLANQQEIEQTYQQDPTATASIHLNESYTGIFNFAAMKATIVCQTNFSIPPEVDIRRRIKKWQLLFFIVPQTYLLQQQQLVQTKQTTITRNELVRFQTC